MKVSFYPKMIIPFKASAPDRLISKPDIQTFDMTVYNSGTNSTSSGTVSIDLSKPQKITLNHNSKKRFENSELILDYDPSRTDFIYDKITGNPIKTVILESKTNGEFLYNFMSEDLRKEYGYVSFEVPSSCDDSRFEDELLINYPEQGIKGERIIVTYLQNWQDSKIGGIGKLADKLAVKFCLDKGIRPNIVSYADYSSHIAHYLRGKRFLPLSKISEAYRFFTRTYGTSDVNEVISTLLKENPDGKININKWGILPMYMPRNMVSKYSKILALNLKKLL